MNIKKEKKWENESGNYKWRRMENCKGIGKENKKLEPL